jgi:hypothetical protein
LAFADGAQTAVCNLFQDIVMLIAHLSDLHVTAPGKLVEGRVDTRAGL